ncbi:MAG TPA: redoxin domain-containing protein [Blastocatellia bacterium]|nr:redoxin domain-containing protein [Blastocatellia bacterium]
MARMTRVVPLVSAAMVAMFSIGPSRVAFSDKEYTGKFETMLESDRDDEEQVIFRPFRDVGRVKLPQPLEPGATVTAGRLYHGQSDKSAILTLLVEPGGEDPFMYADVDMSNTIEQTERFDLEREEENPFIWRATVKEPLKDGFFTSYPLYVRYLKEVQMDELKPGERLILEYRTVFARGFVDIEGKKTLVMYGYKPGSRKITLRTGKLGVDCDGDGNVDLDPLSPEAAEAQDEAVVFRAGTAYVSTKRADLEKNEIVMRSHPSSDYKRIEVRIGTEMPDFEFTDFNGKKRKMSEYRGKYLLIDFWGMWCPPCRRELNYLKAAYQRYQARGFEILGMNTDETEITAQVKSILSQNGMNWTQAKRESITGTIRNLRIHSYPTTILLGPDGKVISLNNTRKDQPSLRGRELLKSLDELLPP